MSNKYANPARNQPLKDEEVPWQPMQPKKYDAEERAAAISRAYYKKTGKVPGPSKVVTLVAKTASPAFQSQKAFDDLFPDWVKEIDDDGEDIKPVDMLVGPSRSAFREMQSAGRIMSPLERRRLAEKRSRGEVSPPKPAGVEDVETEAEQAEAYYHLTKGAGTDFFYSDLSDREMSRRFSTSWASSKILDPSDVMMDPALISAARVEYGDKQRSELTRDQRLRLDELAQKFAFSYGHDFSEHYAYDTKNVVWDDFFDAYVSRYVIEGNLAYAMLDSPTDASGEMKKIAMRNISIATNGEIREDTPIYELLRQLGMRGDELNPLRTSDEYSEMLFTGYYNARRGDFTEREAAIAYAADFGEELLPPSVKIVYDDYMRDWNPHLAKATMVYSQNGLAASVAAEHPGWAGIDPRELEIDPDADISLVREAVLSAVLSLAEAARGETPEMGVTIPAEEPELIVGRFSSGSMPEGRIPEGKVGAGSYLPADKREQFIRAKLLNTLVLPMAMVEPQATGAFDVMNRGLDRALTSLSLITSMGVQDIANDLGLTDDERATPVLSDEEAALMRQYGIEDELSMETMWKLSGALVHKYPSSIGPKAFQHRMWQSVDETYGTKTVENDVLQGVSTFLFGLGVDILTDKGIGIIYKMLKTGGVSLVRAAKAAEGVKVVRETQQGVTGAKQVVRFVRDPSKPSVRLMNQMGFKDTASLTLNDVKAWFGRRLLSNGWKRQVADMEEENAAARVLLGQTTNKKAAKRIADEISEREDTIREILERPLWYDTVAEALAKGDQNVTFLRRFFDISDDGFGWVGFEAGGKAHIDDIAKAKKVNSLNALLGRVGKSRDADEIFGTLLHLKRKYGLTLDPGTDMLGKMSYYDNLLHAKDSASSLSMVLSAGRRIEEGVNDPLSHMAEIGHITNMGCRRGDRSGIKKLSELMDRAANAKGASFNEIATERQKAWDEMWDAIDENLAARGVTDGEKRMLKFLNGWSGAGLDLSKVTNRLELLKAVQKVKLGGKWLRGYGVAREARMYFPIEQIDETTGTVKIVEGSKVTKVPIQLAVARARHERSLKEWNGVVEAASKGKADGRSIESAMREVEEAATNRELAEKAASMMQKHQPFLEGQLGKDLICRHNPHELALFNSSLMKTETLFHLGVFYGHGPSLHGSSVAFRTFVLGTFGFGLKMALSDEFWRLLPEGVWKTMMGNPGEFKAAWKTLTERKDMAKAITNNLVDLMRTSDAWIAVTPDAEDYHIWLNAYIDFLRDNERSVDLLLKTPRGLDETDEVYRARLIAATNEMVFADNQAGRVIREHLKQMMRLPRTGFRTPRGLRASSEAWIREGKRADDEYGRIFMQLEENRARQEALASRIGPLGRPTKEYEVAWLRQNYTQELPGGNTYLNQQIPRQWSDDEVLKTLGDRLKDPDVRRRMKADYHLHLARQRKHTRAYRELLQLKDEKKGLLDARAEAKKLRDHYTMNEPPGVSGGEDYEKWLADTVDNLLRYDSDPVLSEALRTGRKLSRDEVREAVIRMREAGQAPPTVIGVHNVPRFGEGYIPGFSEFAEWGPFRIVDMLSNMMRKATFTHYQMKYYDDFIKQGASAEDAYGRAVHYALRETDRAMFTHNMTVFEYMTKDIILFQPAYRQFIKYWGKLFTKHPMVMASIRENLGKDFPAVRIPGTDFETMMPIPFWMQGSFTDSALPGFGPAIIMPLRIANYATGWTWDEDLDGGKYVYTGATDLDWLEQFPPLSFMSKSSAPSMWVDDLLWGIMPASMSPNPQDNWVGNIWSSVKMSPFKDPGKRQQLAMNIMNAQIAAGIKPDFTGAIEEMRKKPGWWKFLEAMGVENPDAILAMGTRLFNPLTGRIWYEPGDENAKMGDKPFWERWSGTTPRTMADAQWEFLNAYGDEKKMRKVLDEFPRFAEVQKFWDMSIEEREEYLSKDKNLWIVPYITGKYFYEDGLPLVGGEFWVRLKENGIYKRNLDSYIGNMQQLFLDVGFTRVIRSAETDFKRDSKAADKLAKEAIAYYAKGNPLFAENLQYSYDAYKNEWQSKVPGTRETNAKNLPPQFLVNYARMKGIEDDIFKWDIGAIQKRMNDTYEYVKDGGKRLEAHGKQAAINGVADRWTKNGILSTEHYDARLGAARSLTEALTKYVSPQWRSLTDVNYSAYWKDIEEKIKQHDDYNWYLTKQVATGNYYEIPNTASLAAIGVPMKDRNSLDEGLVSLNAAYWEFRNASDGLDSWDDRYKALRAAYLEKRNAILDAPGMDALRGGPAARLYYVLGKGGKGVDKNFLAHVEAVMTKRDSYSTGELVSFWMDRTAWSGAYQVRQKRAAWASLTLVAMRFREQMKKTWNESMGAYGMSPDSQLGQALLHKLTEYATIWGRTCPDFAREYSELGGAELLSSMLDPYS